LVWQSKLLFVEAPDFPRKVVFLHFDGNDVDAFAATALDFHSLLADHGYQIATFATLLDCAILFLCHSVFLDLGRDLVDALATATLDFDRLTCRLRHHIAAITAHLSRFFWSGLIACHLEPPWLGMWVQV
jgi:hypothetical protein